MVKKGVFFSIDALIAVIIILSAIIFISVFYINKPSTSQQVYFSSDLVQILSTMKIGEINDPAVQSLLNEGNITELDRTILEQTLRFQVGGREEEARELLNLTIGNLVPDYYNLGVWIEGFEEPVYATSQEPVTQLISSKQLVSGIEKEKAVEGLASRAFLSGINERTSSAYAYFGGYEGDGNITKKVTLPGGLISIDYAYMELDAGGEFDLYINGVMSGHYTPAQDMRADEWVINYSYLSNFQEGENTIMFSFNGTKKYMGGGYLRVDYSASELVLYEDTGTERYYFPGIDGIINVYSSFYVPGSLDSMSIHLHYKSNYETFLNIGGQTVYSYESAGENIVDIPDEELSLIINYSSLSNKTVPIRMGLRNVSFLEMGVGSIADSVVITDVSGSMCGDCSGVSCAWGSCCGWFCFNCDNNQPDCESCGGTCEEMIDTAKEADKEFVNIVLAAEGNRVGLVSYSSSTQSTHDLSDDNNSLHNEIDSYMAVGATCICCGVISATNILLSQSNGTRAKSMLVMTDGEANRDCDLSPEPPDYDDDGDTTEDPQDHAIQTACDAYQLYNITVYTVGFGDISADAEKVLKNMSECGGGEYFYSNVSDLADTYQDIAKEIVNISYRSQTIVSSSEGAVNTSLFTDSYIEFNYSSPILSHEYGRIPVTIESQRLGNNITEGTFYVPSKINVYDAKVTSYSSDRWTDRALINSSGNWTAFYELSSYGDDYHMLGDPYIVNIPVELIDAGENWVRVSTGVNPSNSTGGSPDDRIIYTIGVDIDINYTGVFEKAEGCSWFIMFEDGTNITIPIPSGYSGSKNCNFDEDTD